MLRKLLVMVILFSTGSCAAHSAPLSPVETPPAAPPSLAPISPLATPTEPIEQGALVQRAIDDLARRLDIEPALLQVRSSTSDELPAGDLGCPQPDRPALAQPAIISGQRIILQAGSVDYEYRASGTQLVYCGPR